MNTGSDFTLDDITVLVVNYRTLDLTERCVSSLLAHYPRIRMILTDNGSADESTAYLLALAKTHQNIQVILHPRNLYHGPALHHALQAATTRLAFSFDSDCRLLQPGLLEALLQVFSDQCMYAAGRLAWMNRFGYELAAPRPGALATIHPSAMLLDREKYLQLAPFFHHGSPGLHNMRSAARAGWRLAHFPLAPYVYHAGRGTCSRYGYGLGWRHRIENILHQIRFLT